MMQLVEANKSLTVKVTLYHYPQCSSPTYEERWKKSIQETTTGNNAKLVINYAIWWWWFRELLFLGLLPTIGMQPYTADLAQCCSFKSDNSYKSTSTSEQVYSRVDALN
ncbi:hypothetical protein HKD37_05G013276 [Glycine soja]